MTEFNAKVEDSDGVYAITVYVTKELWEDLGCIMGLDQWDELGKILGQEAVSAVVKHRNEVKNDSVH